ncbi:MAG: GTPase ObgE [Proteocatella sp.]
MFIDKAHINLKAGNGGDGAVAFRREIYTPAGGPNGGDGGHGGKIIFQVDTNMRTLMDFKYQRKYVAEHGGNGKGANMHGRTGDDLVLRVPMGTVIRDEKTNLVIADLSGEEDRFVVARGGSGGKGNTHFKNSVRQAPNFAKAGRDGQEKNVVLELKLIADVGLLGFPNVGKSTFLSIVTKANPKIANYHFTTLYPNLGVANLKTGDSFVIADIPGIIEGASEGIGLGHDFLRHVERTKVLIHIVDISGIEGRDPLDDFRKINNELEKFNPKMALKPQIIAANKIDLLSDDENLNNFKKTLEAEGYTVVAMSTATRTGVDEVLQKAAEMLSEAEAVEIFEEEDYFVNASVEPTDSEKIDIRVENGVYVVEGSPMEKLLYSVHFEDMESIRYFQKMLEQYKVFDRLRTMGIEDGDTVRIYNLEFDFFE